MSSTVTLDPGLAGLTLQKATGENYYVLWNEPSSTGALSGSAYFNLAAGSTLRVWQIGGTAETSFYEVAPLSSLSVGLQPVIVQVL